MPRIKGARNRSSYVKEILATGYKGDHLDSLSLDAIKQVHYEVVENGRVQPAQPQPTVVAAPPTEPQAAIPPELAKTVFDSTMSRLGDMAAYYNCEEPVPDRITDYLLKVYYASTTDEANAIGKKTLEKFFMYLMHQWQTKHITGPNTADNIESRAKSAESWATRLEKEGKKEAAEKQRQKAAAIRATPVTTTKGWF